MHFIFLRSQPAATERDNRDLFQRGAWTGRMEDGHSKGFQFSQSCTTRYVRDGFLLVFFFSLRLDNTVETGRLGNMIYIALLIDYDRDFSLDKKILSQHAPFGILDQTL